MSTLLLDSTFDGSDIASLDTDGSINEIRQLPPEKTAFERSVLDTISEVGQKAAGVQHNDWYLIGSHLAVPHFPTLFVESWSQPEVRNRDIKTLADETRAVLDELESRADDNRPSHLKTDGQAIAEEHGISSEKQTQEIIDQLRRAADLANYTPVLRDISENEDYSEGAIVAAASIMMDPNHRTDEDEVYRRAWEQRHSSINIPDHVIDRYGNRGGFRRGEESQRSDWYQSAQRKSV